VTAKCEPTIILFALLILSVGSSCVNPAEQQAEIEPVSPATMETIRVGEETLATVRLTAQAKERLGITTSEARVAPAIRYYTVAGEIVVPPGQALVVTAPFSGTILITSEFPSVGTRIESGQQLLEIKPLLSVPRDLRTNAEADVGAALTRLDAAKLRAERAENMLRDRVGSERAREESIEAVRLAETALAAAEARLEQIESAPMDGDVSVQVAAPQGGILRQMQVASGQVVSAGTPLFEIVRFNPLWVRTPIYSGDLGDLRPGASALVRPINASPSTKGRRAPPVSAPPTADPRTSTTDYYYELPNKNLTLHPGERVSVSVPMQGSEECLQVPYSAILFDMQGGTWVYEEIEPLAYTRRRVLVDYVVDQDACLAQGPKRGTAVVASGGPEIFGEEFGVGH
jgi:cobalt-zinc-cadmium efflux system membrane fusion protein